MKVLSVCQPWATLIAKGYKPVETRTWKRDYRGPLAIHASKSGSDCMIKELWKKLFYHFPEIGSLPLDFPKGQIIATCTLKDIIIFTKESFIELEDQHLCKTPFFEFVPYGFVLTDIKKLENPIHCNGKLGLWNFDMGENKED